MTDQQRQELLDNFLTGLAQLRVETAELRASQATTDATLAKQIAENRKGFAEQRKQMDNVMRGLGYTAEGLAIPSIKTILVKQFGMESVVENARRIKGERMCEYDVLGYANSTTNLAIVAEVKNRANDAAIDQVLEQITEFHSFYPEHRDKKVQGLLAAVNFPPDVKKRALDSGLHIAILEDDLFTLQDPKGFVAKSY